MPLNWGYFYIISFFFFTIMDVNTIPVTSRCTYYVLMNFICFTMYLTSRCSPYRFSQWLVWCTHHILYLSLLGKITDIFRYDNEITRLPHLAGKWMHPVRWPQRSSASLRTFSCTSWQVRSHTERMGGRQAGDEQSLRNVSTAPHELIVSWPGVFGCPLTVSGATTYVLVLLYAPVLRWN